MANLCCMCCDWAFHSCHPRSPETLHGGLYGAEAGVHQDRGACSSGKPLKAWHP